MNLFQRNPGISRNYLFLLLLIAVYLLIDYQTILFLSPQGIHFIRQTDSLSFAANYFSNGFHFFQPRVFNLQSLDGKAACEFPVLYYIAALLYQLFGEKEFILRSITVIIASSGYFFLFRLLHVLLKDLVYALAFTFLFISSTVLLYYTNNFLPDASALGFTLIGWYYFYDFFQHREKRGALLAGFLFFTLASLLKVTYFANPVAAVFACIVFDFSQGMGSKGSLKNNVFPFALFSLSLLFVLAWNVFVYYYNKASHDTYFLIHANPIWSLNKAERDFTWDHVTVYWYHSYYYHRTFQFFGVIIVAGTLFLRKSEKIILIPAIISAMGSLSYFLLFFAQFKAHDYYFMAIIPTVVFLVINGFVAVRNRFPRLVNHFVPKLVLIALCILSLKFARERLVERYTDTASDMYAVIGHQLSGTRQYLDSIGIPGKAKFIVVTDQSPNGGLYFLNRPGWNVIDTTQAGRTAIRNYIGQGADYILFTDKKYVDMIDAKVVRAGEDRGILIYSISSGDE